MEFQFNAAGDINVGSIDSIERVAAELAKFRSEIDKARAANALPEETAIEAQAQLLEASRAAASKIPTQSAILGPIRKATDFLKGTAAMAALVTALAKLAESVKDLIH